MRAEQLTDPLTFHGEGPAYSPRWAGPRWVDMLAGDVLELAPDGAVARNHVGSVAAAIRPRRSGGHVIAGARGLLIADEDDLAAPLRHLPDVWSDESIRMNEGGCDPAGAFYVGTVSKDHRLGAASLYRFDPDGAEQVVIDGVTVSNGIEWSPDSSLCYYVDTETLQVDVFNWDACAGLHDRRAFVTFSADEGDPDGLTVDAEGGVWVALFGGSEIRRYSPQGTLDVVVDIPVCRVTSMAFSGPTLETLIVTTSRKGLDLPVENEAGALFVVTPGFAGQSLREFAG